MGYGNSGKGSKGATKGSVGKGKGSSKGNGGKGKQVQSKEKWVSAGGGLKTLIGKQKCTVKLAVDGQVAEVEADPVVTLADYLRGKGKTCTKIGCGEGGCGACTVMISSWAAGESKPEYRTVNACLMMLAACDGQAIITVDGLGNSRKGFHPVQERLAENNGSQCGFCSPGMVMSMYGWLKKTDNKPKKEDGEKCLDGNLCRCTGYRAILKAYQSLVDKKVDLSKTELPFPDELKGYTPRPLYFAGSGKEWYAPVRVQDVFAVQKEVPNNAKIQLTAGNTARGIYKTEDQVDVFVDIRGIPELQEVKADDDGITFGGAVTIAKFITTLEEFFQKKGEKGAPGFPTICDHAKKIAGNQIRNWGTMAGNLMITKSLGFQSDLATILSGAGASVVLANDSGEDKKLPIAEFLSPSFPMPSSKRCLLQSITLPFSAGETFVSFKVAKRPQNSHAIVNATCKIKKQGDSIESATMFFGALTSSPSGPVGPFHATKTEEALKGQKVNTETFQKALSVLVTEAWWPRDEFEQQLAKSYLLRLFQALTGKERSDVNLKTTLSDIRPVGAYGEQNVLWGVDEKIAPISKPVPRVNGKVQAAGEARYTADMPEAKDTLFGAYVLITLPNVKVTKVDTSAALKMPGVYAYVDAKDIPEGGKNVGCSGADDDVHQKLFVPVGEVTQFAGQPAGMILADTQKHAEMAAKKVKVSTAKSDAPTLLTIEQCHKVGGDKAKPMHDVKRGDATQAIKEAKHQAKGTAYCNAQRHFYMEPMNAYVVPEDDGQMTVYHSQQVSSWTHKGISRVLNKPLNKVIVNCPLIGGGFGGKLTRSMHVANAAAVAANKTGKPVKLILNRNVDMVMTGGRHHVSADYEVGFNDDGKITGVKVKMDADAGFSKDGIMTGFVSMVLDKAVEQAYGLENLESNVHGCYTHKPTATAMRGPGEPQASFVVETILEHIAAELKIDPQVVREINIFKDKAEQAEVAKNPQMDAGIQKVLVKDSCGNQLHDHPLPGIWEHLKKTAKFSVMQQEVVDYNKSNKWRKRGIAMTPVRYAVGCRKQQAHMCVYKDGTVIITVDGTEIGQGLWTKVQQFASYYLTQVTGAEVPISAIRMQPVGTDRITEGSITGGSTTSEGCGEAVKDCINQFKERFKDLITGWDKEKDGDISFAKICGKAAGGGFGSSDCMQFAGKNEYNPGFGYYVYGACVSTVEIDVITGETTVLASKLCYDCGKSLNPHIDAGQCEGAFMQGLGFFIREELIEDEKTGELLSDGTWEYKIPCAQDSPIQFDVEFFPRPFGHEKAILSSKASGEPPLVLATAVFMAVRAAITAARKEFGIEEFFRLDAPACPRSIALLCKPKIETFTI